MVFISKVVDIKQLDKTCAIVGIFEDGSLTQSAESLDKIAAGKINALIKTRVFEGKLGNTFLVPELKNTQLDYVLLVGCGPKEKCHAMAFKKLLSCTGRALFNNKIKHVTCFLGEVCQETNAIWQAKIIAQTILENTYQFTFFKSKKEPEFHFQTFTIPCAKQDLKSTQRAIEQGVAIAQAMCWTRNLGNMPSNICTPTFLAEQAKALTKNHPTLIVKILNEKAMQKLNMGMLLSVSQGSAEEAKLICLEYKGGKKNQAPIVFVGKGITFDTGGNSLKPADAMVGMKYDMCGAATVLGVLQATAALKLPLNVMGVIPAVENMPGGTAYKPEDILTSMSGQTVEVISTDAEGRLILGDALTYCERFKPDTVIDIATLTGAAVIALGIHATALMTNQQSLADDLLVASEESLDRAWQLPMWDEYQAQLKSPFADMANVGGRPAGAITAGCFLSRFAKKFHWAHLDVAGSAAIMAGQNERNATGRPVPMLMQYLINRCQKS